MKLSALILLVISYHFSLSQIIEIEKKDHTIISTEITAFSQSNLYTRAGDIKIVDISIATFDIQDDNHLDLYKALRTKGVFLKYRNKGKIEKSTPTKNEQKVIHEDSEEIAYFDWKLIGNDLIWEHVYAIDSTSVEEIKKRLMTEFKSKTYIREMEIDSNEINALVTDLQVDFKKIGLTRLTCSALISEGKWDGKLLAQIKDNKYRITLSGLTVDAGTVSVYYGFGVAGTSNAGGTAANLFLTKNQTKFKDLQRPNMDNLTLYFNDQFTTKKSKDKRRDF